MTKIQIFKNNKKITKFVLSGHTNKDIYGQDVLCAGISAISQSTVLGVKNVLKINAEIQKNDDTGYLKLDLSHCSRTDIEKSQVLLETMLESLKDISKENEKFMKVEVYDEIY